MTPRQKKLVENFIRKIIREESGNYNESLNMIFEDSANEELKRKLSPNEYNLFFKLLEKLDNNASPSAISMGDSYFPIDTLSDGIEYLENYIEYFRPSGSLSKFQALLKKLK